MQWNWHKSSKNAMTPKAIKISNSGLSNVQFLKKVKRKILPNSKKVCTFSIFTVSRVFQSFVYNTIITLSWVRTAASQFRNFIVSISRNLSKHCGISLLSLKFIFHGAKWECRLGNWREFTRKLTTFSKHFFEQSSWQNSWK